MGIQIPCAKCGRGISYGAKGDTCLYCVEKPAITAVATDGKMMHATQLGEHTWKLEPIDMTYCTLCTTGRAKYLTTDGNAYCKPCNKDRQKGERKPCAKCSHKKSDHIITCHGGGWRDYCSCQGYRPSKPKGAIKIGKRKDMTAVKSNNYSYLTWKTLTPAVIALLLIPVVLVDIFFFGGLFTLVTLLPLEATALGLNLAIAQKQISNVTNDRKKAEQMIIEGYTRELEEAEKQNEAALSVADKIFLAGNGWVPIDMTKSVKREVDLVEADMGVLKPAWTVKKEEMVYEDWDTNYRHTGKLQEIKMVMVDGVYKSEKEVKEEKQRQAKLEREIRERQEDLAREKRLNDAGYDKKGQPLYSSKHYTASGLLGGDFSIKNSDYPAALSEQKKRIIAAYNLPTTDNRR